MVRRLLFAVSFIVVMSLGVFAGMNTAHAQDAVVEADVSIASEVDPQNPDGIQCGFGLDSVKHVLPDGAQPSLDVLEKAESHLISTQMDQFVLSPDGSRVMTIREALQDQGHNLQSGNILDSIPGQEDSGLLPQSYCGNAAVIPGSVIHQVPMGIGMPPLKVMQAAQKELEADGLDYDCTCPINCSCTVYLNYEQDGCCNTTIRWQVYYSRYAVCGDSCRVVCYMIPFRNYCDELFPCPGFSGSEIGITDAELNETQSLNQ